MSILQKLAAETIIYGGCRATRIEVYRDCISLGLPAKVADQMAFGQFAVAVDPATVADLPTLESIKNAGLHGVPEDPDRYDADFAG